MAHLLTPPVLPIGARVDPRKLPHLYDGVLGFAVQEGPWINILMVSAVSEGSGLVGKWLDRLHPCVRFINVASPRLCGMLARRRWTRHWITYNSEPYNIWYHPTAVLPHQTKPTPFYST